MVPTGLLFIRRIFFIDLLQGNLWRTLRLTVSFVFFDNVLVVNSFKLDKLRLSFHFLSKMSGCLQRLKFLLQSLQFLKSVQALVLDL
jgi:hypothetical protein